MTEAEEDALAEAYEAALTLEKSGDAAGAVQAWRVVLALNPADPGGAAIRLAALGQGDVLAKAPAAYVATLFDQHAEVFDGILVDQLEYGVPMMVRERLQAVAPGPFRRMLDLGCGTGLAAEALEDMTTTRWGVDLAEGMIEVAGEKDLYDRLFIADAVTFLDETPERWDIVVATDVLPYLGDVAPLFRAVAARAEAGAVFTFSTETLPSAVLAGRPWCVTPQHRFAHDPAYVLTELAAAGFSAPDVTDIMVRRENGAPIEGHLFLCTRL